MITVVIRFGLGLLWLIIATASIPFQFMEKCGFMCVYHHGYLSLVVTHLVVTHSQLGINLVSLFLDKLIVSLKRSFDLAIVRDVYDFSIPLSTFKVALVT
jgi:hypothetical protein